MNKLNVTALPGGATEIEEPDWSVLIPDCEGEARADNSVWRKYAHREWIRLIRALRPAETLSAENWHELQRLVISYVRYDQTCAERFRLGLITKAPRTDTAQMNVAQTEMRQADADATIHEAELGITPRRRGSVTKSKRVQKISRASDIYLTNPNIK